MEKPVFIGGAGSSGSTLLSVLLNRHPEIACGPEMSFFNKSRIYDVSFDVFRAKFNSWSKKGLNTDGYWLYPGFLLNREYYGLTQENLNYFLRNSNSLKEFTDHVIEIILQKEKKRIFAEKTPSNAYCFKKIVKLYPDAKIVHLYRDGRDAFCSFKKKTDHPFMSSSAWLYNTVAALSCETLPNYLATSYEQLVSNTRETLKAICDHIEIEYSERMLDQTAEEIEEKTRQGHRAWMSRPKDAISTSSIGRYKTEMTETDKAIFWNTALTKNSEKMLETKLRSPVQVLTKLGYSSLEGKLSVRCNLRQRIDSEKTYIKKLIRSIKLGRGMIYRKTRLY